MKIAENMMQDNAHDKTIKSTEESANPASNIECELKCDECSYSSSNERNIRMHRKNEHNGPPNLKCKCDQCMITSESKQALQ